MSAPTCNEIVEGRSGTRGQRTLLGRADAILGAFSETQPSLPLGALTEATGLPRSTVHRLAEQLVELGWLTRGATGYTVGLTLFERGSLMASSQRMTAVATRWLQWAHKKTGLVVHLGLLDGGEVVYLDKVCDGSVRVSTRVGGRLPAHSTALGKASLAYGATQCDRGGSWAPLAAMTEATITDPVVLETSLARVRQHGFALDEGEAQSDIRCVGAPIRGGGRALGAVSLCGPRERLDVARCARIVTAVASRIWTDMWVRPGSVAG